MPTTLPASIIAANFRARDEFDESRQNLFVSKTRRFLQTPLNIKDLGLFSTRFVLPQKASISFSWASAASRLPGCLVISKYLASFQRH